MYLVTLKVLVFALKVLVFALKVLVFTLKVLVFALKVLVFALKVLVFALKVLLFTLKATHFDLSYLPRHTHVPPTWHFHRLILLAENAVKPPQKRVKNSKLNLDFIIIHSIVIIMVIHSLKRQITIAIQFFVTRKFSQT